MHEEYNKVLLGWEWKESNDSTCVWEVPSVVREPGNRTLSLTSDVHRTAASQTTATDHDHRPYR